MRNTLIIVLLLLAGCKRGEEPATLQVPATGASMPLTAANDFVARAWMRADSVAAPGSIRIFLPDGTLLMDSCFETYRIARWRATARDSLIFVEDGRETPVAIIRQDSAALHLRVMVPGDPVEEFYRTISDEYVCPDMPR